MVEIGQTIAQARQEQGLELQEIAEKTRINLKYLQALEQGKFDFLPRPYVIAYLKLVAGIVGLDGEALIRTWREREAALAAEEMEAGEGAQPIRAEESLETRQEPPPAPTQSIRSERTLSSPPPPPATIPYVKEIALGIALLAGMALLLYFSTQSSERANTSAPEDVQEIPFDQVAKEAAEKLEEEPPAAIVESAPVKRPMRLEVRAQDSVWVQVVTDKRDSSDYTMRRGSVQAWIANAQFYVVMGNAAAVKIFLDGKELGEIGRQVRSVLITHDGIQSRRLRGVARRTTEAEQPAQQDTTRNN